MCRFYGAFIPGFRIRNLRIRILQWEIKNPDPDPGNHPITDLDPDPTFELQIDKERHQNMSKFKKISVKNGFI